MELNNNAFFDKSLGPSNAKAVEELPDFISIEEEAKLRKEEPLLQTADVRFIEGGYYAHGYARKFGETFPGANPAAYAGEHDQKRDDRLEFEARKLPREKAGNNIIIALLIAFMFASAGVVGYYVNEPKPCPHCNETVTPMEVMVNGQ